jgi:hypothetical protein
MRLVERVWRDVVADTAVREIDGPDLRQLRTRRCPYLGCRPVIGRREVTADVDGLLARSGFLDRELAELREVVARHVAGQ